MTSLPGAGIGERKFSTHVYKPDFGTGFGTIGLLYIVYMRAPPPKRAIPPPTRESAHGGRGVFRPSKFFDYVKKFGLSFSHSIVQYNGEAVALCKVAVFATSKVQHLCNSSAVAKVIGLSPSRNIYAPTRLPGRE